MMPRALRTALPRAKGERATQVVRFDWTGTGEVLLVAVAAAYTLAQLALVRPGMGLGWDEVVYVSQLSDQAPPAFFSAPRARGMSLLVAPISLWSSSTRLLRIYLAVLSGVGVYLALRAWRGLFPVRVIAVGGVLFVSLWITLFYGPQAMPNLWVAIGALAAVGCFLRAPSDSSSRGAAWGLAAGAAVMAWMRPVDALWVSLPMLALLVGVRRWRNWKLLAALVAGLVAGAGEWVFEAYARYAGLGQRLTDGSRIQGGLGWNIAVDDQLRSLGGRTLCRPCTSPMPSLLLTAWWFALLLLAVLAVVVAVRSGRTARTLVPVVCAAAAGIPYLLLIGYAAPRFLLPFYALLAIPAASALIHLVIAPGGRWRVAGAGVVAIGLAGHLAVQYAVLQNTVERTTAAHQGWTRVAERLHRLGVHPPCVLTGHEAIPIAFYAGCGSADTAGNNANSTVAGLTRTAQRIPVAALTTRTARPPSFARTWRVFRLEGSVYAYIAPAMRDEHKA